MLLSLFFSLNKFCNYNYLILILYKILASEEKSAANLLTCTNTVSAERVLNQLTESLLDFEWTETATTEKR